MTIIEKVSGYRSRAINALIDAVHAIRIVPGPGLEATETPGGTLLRLSQTTPPRAWPYGEHFAFGISIAGATVTVHPGSVQAGGQAYTAVETPITITADGQYIGLALDRSAGTLTITGPHSGRPTSSGDTWRTALYVFSYTAGTPAHARLQRECIHDLRLEAAL